VALGASIQASALLNAGAAVSGQASYLLDVTPLTLRLGTVGGFTERIIDKNTPIPIEKSKTFTTSRDGQERVKIRVYQGESNRADECELLGEFEFAGFRIGYRGEVQIQVTFEIDPDGIVNVSAMDLESGQRASTTISLSSGLSEQDIRSAIDKNAEVALAGHSG
jgi:molecular chaperone DnaK